VFGVVSPGGCAHEVVTSRPTGSCPSAGRSDRGVAPWALDRLIAAGAVLHGVPIPGRGCCQKAVGQTSIRVGRGPSGARRPRSFTPVSALRLRSRERGRAVPRLGFPQCSTRQSTTDWLLPMDGACAVVLLSLFVALEHPQPAHRPGGPATSQPGWPARYSSMADSGRRRRCAGPGCIRLSLPVPRPAARAAAIWLRNPNGSAPTTFEVDQNSITPSSPTHDLSVGPGRRLGGRRFYQSASTATMTAYYNDLKLFFRRAGAFPPRGSLLHVEPACGAISRQRTINDSASTFAVRCPALACQNSRACQ
jgi:hypothetical protein